MVGKLLKLGLEYYLSPCQPTRPLTLPCFSRVLTCTAISLGCNANATPSTGRISRKVVGPPLVIAGATSRDFSLSQYTA